MTLKEWLEKHGVSDAEFARRCDVSPVTIGRLRRGKTKPDWSTMTAIYRETEGEVEPNDFGVVPAKAKTQEPKLSPGDCWRWLRDWVLG